MPGRTRCCCIMFVQRRSPQHSNSCITCLSLPTAFGIAANKLLSSTRSMLSEAACVMYLCNVM